MTPLATIQAGCRKRLFFQGSGDRDVARGALRQDAELRLAPEKMTFFGEPQATRTVTRGVIGRRPGQTLKPHRLTR